LDAKGVGRDMVWDAENRLKEIIDNKEGLFHSYAYNHSGERILKRYGTAQNAYYKGKDMGTLYDIGESYSAYASAYFVENNSGYTKPPKLEIKCRYSNSYYHTVMATLNSIRIRMA
jgi:hypothetical protein